MGEIIRWGAKTSPGVGVEENLGQRQIAGADLGSVGVPGIMPRGPVGKMTRSRTIGEWLARHGDGMLYDDVAASFSSYIPDQIRGFFKASDGAGQILSVRLEGALAAKASVTFPSRKTAALGGGNALTLRAKDEGRWGGRFLAATLTGVVTAVTATTVVIGAASYVVDQWKGAVLTNTTRSHSFIVQSNTSTTLNAPTGSDLVATHGYIVGDTITINLAHDANHLGFLLSPGRIDEVNEFSLDVYLDGRLIRGWDRLSMNPVSDWYVTTILTQDEGNFYVEAVDEWSAASKPWEADANPTNARGLATALAAQLLTDAGASFPTVAIEGYDLTGGTINHPSDRRSFARIISNTATAIVTTDDVDLTVLMAASNDYEIIQRIRPAGGMNDHNGVTASSYITQLTAGTSAFDASELRQFGLVKLGIPGLSGFAAADRKAINDAGILYCKGRPWEWRLETPSFIDQVNGHQNIADLYTVSDFLFGSAANQLALDEIFAFVEVVSWQLVRFANRLVEVPTMFDVLGLEAKQASATGGYVDPAAGTGQQRGGFLPRAVDIDLDRDARPSRQLMEQFSSLGMNFIIERDGRFYPWGARTPQKTQPEYTFSTHRQQMSHLALTFLESRTIELAVLRPNVPQLRAQVLGQLDAFLRNEYEEGRLDKSVPYDEAAVLNVSSEINTSAVVASGLLIVELMVKLPGLAELVLIRMSKAGVEVALAA